MAHKASGMMNASLAVLIEKRAAKQREAEAKQEQEIARLHQRAQQNGLVEKTAGESGAAGKLRNKWKRWLNSSHGQAAATRLTCGGCPTVEEAKLFATWVYQVREKYSPVGQKGGGDSYGLLQIPYMLGKYVFPLMQYEGWTGITVAEAKVKNKPYADALKAHWQVYPIVPRTRGHLA